MPGFKLTIASDNHFCISAQSGKLVSAETGSGVEIWNFVETMKL